MEDYRIYYTLKLKKKIIKIIDRAIKKLVYINWKNRQSKLSSMLY